MSAQGVSAWGDLPRPGGVCLGGVYLPDTPLPVNRMTDRCKNITLPQLCSLVHLLGHQYSSFRNLVTITLGVGSQLRHWSPERFLIIIISISDTG